MLHDEMKLDSGFNSVLLGLTLCLAAVGLLNLFSALYSWGEAGFMRLFWLQLMWIGIGVVVMILLNFWDYRLLYQWAYWLYGISLLLLILVLLTGHTVAGHRSWLGVGGFGIQPSEIAKVTTLLVLAHYYADNPNPHGYALHQLWYPTLLVLIPALLIVAEGDLGTTVYFFLIWASFAWFAHIRRGSMILLLVLALGGGMLGYLYVLSPYQKARVVAFLNPEMDQRGRGYQVTQSKIAVGSGGWTGKGYRSGSVNKLNYLPEKHTDFIFPVLAEEWGFLGCLIVVGLYYSLLTLAIQIGREARDRLGSFLAIGVGAFLFWQLAINLGGVLGLMPMTGVTLPLLSYGGSSVLTVFFALGLLMSISRRRNIF